MIYLNSSVTRTSGVVDFSTQDSLSSNNSRKVAKGTAEVIWFVGKLSVDKFPASLGLLNLR